MKKHKLLSATLLLAGILTYAQEGRVGVNTSSPAATLDVVASPDNANRTDGFIAPRISKTKLQAKDGKYGADQNAAIVYVDDISGSATSDKVSQIDAIGYYYFDKTVGTDGGQWVKMKGNGGTGTAIEPWYNEGTTTQASSNTNNIYQTAKVGIGNFSSASSIKSDLQVSNVANDKTDTGNTSGGIEIGQLGLGGFGRKTPSAYLKAVTTSGQRYNDQANLEFGTSNGGGGNASTKMILTNTGNVGINTLTPTTKLHIDNGSTNGAIRIVDGTQGVNKVLTSDANGVGTWVSLQNQFTMARYIIRNVNADWLNNFDTKVSSANFAMQITNAVFIIPNSDGSNDPDGTLRMHTPSSGNAGTGRTYFAAQYSYATTQGGTWRLIADFRNSGTEKRNASDTAEPNGTWIFDVLIIDKRFVSDKGVQEFNLNGSSTGTATTAVVTRND
ncbi:hypothetical protein [Daejeonia sp. YH14]|uniref:hypothetical protein n=1 Tax=Daejeonia sp. YH14 TaxID=3439042 RepID=UPI003F4905E0